MTQDLLVAFIPHAFTALVAGATAVLGAWAAVQRAQGDLRTGQLLAQEKINGIIRSLEEVHSEQKDHRQFVRTLGSVQSDLSSVTRSVDRLQRQVDNVEQVLLHKHLGFKARANHVDEDADG